ncbi:MAG: hypothetical protein XD78_1179 [Desulfotomaculum sp. 46_296]|nr:MAG: hypothetical protein XD78_1179 [Desulfotomaculum sp. 46_296]HAU30748.1 hypothetical protein [Desulfotomaculum sp.]
MDQGQGTYGLENTLFSILERSGNSGVDQNNLLILMSLLNLMGIVNILGQKRPGKTEIKAEPQGE